MSFKRLLLTLLITLTATQAHAIETTARNVIIMDFETGQYLYTKDHQKMIPPASMSKLMTTYMIFSKLKDGSLKLDDEFSVSENAWRKGGASSGGSTMFLPLKSTVKVEDILKGIIIQSGNDACIVSAENISGSEENFAQEMNQKAREIGLYNSYFANSTGLPHPDHKMSVEDLAILSKRLIQDFPEFYHMFSEQSFTFNKIKQGNRNPLLYSMQYADGLKTGHTEEAGFCLTASAKKGDRRLISVMAGMESNKERSAESNKVMAWGFREFDNYTLLQKGRKIATVPVWQGKEKEVDLIVSEDVRQTLHRSRMSKIKMTAIYEKPIKAPIKKGDKLGFIKVQYDTDQTKEFPLVANKDIKAVSWLGKVANNFKYILLGAQ